MGIAVSRSSKNVFQRLAAFRERFGVKAAAWKTLDIVLHKVLRTHVHRVVWLELESVAKMAPLDGFTFRFLTADEVAEFAKDPSYYIHPSLVNGIHNGHEVCFAALAGDRLAAFGCYSLGFAPPDQASGACISFPNDVAYMSFGFTHPDFRGYRLHGLIMGLPLQELAKRGITKFVSLVSWTNWSSLKSCDRLGWLNLGNMITIGGPRRAVGFYPKAAKRLGVRFGRNAVRPR
jgi:hypothetical protein